MKSKFLIQLLETVLVTAFLAATYLPNIGSVQFQTDESQWIGTSNMLESYVGLKFNSPIWGISYWNITQPPVPRYLIGIGRLLSGYGAQDLNPPWDYGESVEFNLAHGVIPSDDLLWCSRLSMTVLGILSIVIGFLFLKQIYPAAGYVWLGLMAGAPYFLVQFRRAMGESPLMLFSVLTLYFLVRALKTIEIADPVQARKRAFLWLGLAGIASGLAWASKLNGVMLLGAGIPIAFYLGNRLNTNMPEKIRYRYLYALLVGAGCFLIFVAVNPFLWHSTLLRIYMMFGNRAFEMNLQAIQFPESNMYFPERFYIIPMRVFHDYARLQIPAWMNMVPALAGVVMALVSARNMLSNRNSNPELTALLLVSFFTVTPIWLSQKDWDRYYIYPVFFSSMFMAVAMGWLFHKIVHTINEYAQRSSRSWKRT